MKVLKEVEIQLMTLLRYLGMLTGYPTIVFFDKDANPIAPITGYLNPNQIEIYLKALQRTKSIRISKSQEDFKKVYGFVLLVSLRFSFISFFNIQHPKLLDIDLVFLGEELQYQYLNPESVCSFNCVFSKNCYSSIILFESQESF